MTPWYDDALYRECVPTRPTPAPAGCTLNGPTAQWLALEGQRELWALAVIELERGAA